MSDYGASGRRDTFRLSLVDPFTLEDDASYNTTHDADGNEIEAFRLVDGEGSITWGYYTDNLYSASLQIVADSIPDGFDMNAWTRLARVHHTCELPDGTEFSETLCTIFVSDCEKDALDGVDTYSIGGYSPLLRFTGEVLTQDFSRPKGYVITEEVEELVTSNGGLLRIGSGVDTTRTHTNPIIFEANTLQSTVLNTIAGWTDCQLGVDGDGYVVWDAYTAPSEQGAVYDFEDGENCTYLPGYTETDSNDDKVNRVFAYYSRDSKDDDDEYPLSLSVVVDLPDEYPCSYANIGRRSTYAMQVGDPCSEAELTSKAETYLYENCDEIRYLEIENVGIPGLEVGQCVNYSNSGDGAAPIGVKCLVTEIDMSLKPGCPCKTKLKVVG